MHLNVGALVETSWHLIQLLPPFRFWCARARGPGEIWACPVHGKQRTDARIPAQTKSLDRPTMRAIRELLTKGREELFSVALLIRPNLARPSNGPCRQWLSVVTR